MKRFSRSRTAEWVAVARAAGAFLPREERLAADPYGADFGSPWLRALLTAAEAQPALMERVLKVPSALRNFVLWMQLRTRAIDDAVLDFAARAGCQIVLLGAGHDMRAVRFRAALGNAALFEVDHPITQARKRSLLLQRGLGSDSRYAAFDFEREPLSELGAKLVPLGFSRERPTMTVWEGVTMYLTESAIDASFRAIRSYSAAGSRLVVSYLDARAVRAPGSEQRLTQRLVALAGEPYLFGFSAGSFEPYAEQRGFRVAWDTTDRELAERHLPNVDGRMFRREERHIAALNAV